MIFRSTAYLAVWRAAEDPGQALFEGPEEAQVAWDRDQGRSLPSWLVVLADGCLETAARAERIQSGWKKPFRAEAVRAEAARRLEGILLNVPGIINQAILNRPPPGREFWLVAEQIAAGEYPAEIPNLIQIFLLERACRA